MRYMIMFSDKSIWSILDLNTGMNTKWTNLRSAYNLAVSDIWMFDDEICSVNTAVEWWGSHPKREFVYYEIDSLESVEEVYPELFI